jgi:hypothetical protein
MPTSIKNDAKQWTIKEQIIEDLVTGLTFQFEVSPNGEPRFRIYGKDLPFGNREIFFTLDGEEGGSGTATQGICRAGWLQLVEEE